MQRSLLIIFTLRIRFRELGEVITGVENADEKLSRKRERRFAEFYTTLNNVNGCLFPRRRNFLTITVIKHSFWQLHGEREYQENVPRKKEAIREINILMTRYYVEF